MCYLKTNTLLRKTKKKFNTSLIESEFFLLKQKGMINVRRLHYFEKQIKLAMRSKSGYTFSVVELEFSNAVDL